VLKVKEQEVRSQLPNLDAQLCLASRGVCPRMAVCVGGLVPACFGAMCAFHRRDGG
jgi:hypothetical protein